MLNGMIWQRSNILDVMEAFKFYLCLFGRVILVMASQGIDFGLLRIFFPDQLTMVYKHDVVGCCRFFT